jgi:NAD(P)-dependent dehydrogenase (short-subunit alcohol dehydrogenase family)
MKQYFITGATGAIGSALVPVLLQGAARKADAAAARGFRRRSEHPPAIALYRFWQPSIGDTSWRSAYARCVAMSRCRISASLPPIIGSLLASARTSFTRPATCA